jgi:hypothetical protein
MLYIMVENIYKLLFETIRCGITIETGVQRMAMYKCMYIHTVHDNST